jgi:hypothetical protein
MSDAAAETTMTLAQFATWLAEQLRAARLIDVKVWTGRNGAIRIYRGQDYVPVTLSEENYGGPLGRYVGHNRGLVAALTAACERVVATSPEDGTVFLSGEVAVPAAAGASAKSDHFGSQFGKCAECGGPTRNGAHVLRQDSSGLTGWCCSRCAALSAAHRSFA